MNLEELKNTEWAKEFKEFSSLCYEQAIGYILDNCTVEIYQTDETGDWQWAISVIDKDGEPTKFWLDAKETKEEAIKLCKEMGWKVEEGKS